MSLLGYAVLVDSEGLAPSVGVVGRGVARVVMGASLVVARESVVAKAGTGIVLLEN